MQCGVARKVDYNLEEDEDCSIYDSLFMSQCLDQGEQGLLNNFCVELTPYSHRPIGRADDSLYRCL